MSNQTDKARARDFIFRSLDSELTPRVPRPVMIDDLQREFATVRQEERRAAFDESAESIVNEAGKVGQLMNLAAASARKEERATVKSMLEDYFKHFFCTCHGSTRTGGHFASCPINIRDEVLGRLVALEAAAKGEDGDDG